MQGQLDVLPGVGIGTIRFGMRCDEVLALIDEPSCHEEWMGGNLCDALLYHGLRLHFSEYNSDGPLPFGQLGELFICGREDAVLFGRQLFSWHKSEIVDQFKKQNMAPELLKNGDVEVVCPYTAMSFDADDRVCWFETAQGI